MYDIYSLSSSSLVYLFSFILFFFVWVVEFVMEIERNKY